MNDPLAYYLSRYGADAGLIQEIVIGSKYAAVLLKSGNIGVCSTLNRNLDLDRENLAVPDLDNVGHRVLLNAYYNALLNYGNEYDTETDIFDRINFRNYGSIVMVGYFRSLVNKFERENIPLKIFDMAETGEKLAPMAGQMAAIAQADAVILSGTTVFNMTYGNIMETVSPGSDVFLLGPSNILDREMFAWPSLRVVFGSVFEPGDRRVLEAIRDGGGTPSFLPWLKKVYLEAPER